MGRSMVRDISSPMKSLVANLPFASLALTKMVRDFIALLVSLEKFREVLFFLEDLLDTLFLILLDLFLAPAPDTA